MFTSLFTHCNILSGFSTDVDYHTSRRVFVGFIAVYTREEAIHRQRKRKWRQIIVYSGNKQNTVPSFHRARPCVIEKKNRAQSEDSDDLCCSFCSFAMKQCCIYTFGVGAILLLLVGISLVLSGVFPRFLQSVVEKVSVDLRWSLWWLLILAAE